jgi:hypothetical protein
LTETGSKTRFRAALPDAACQPSDAGRRPAREFRAPARFASKLPVELGQRACSTH